MCKDYFVQLYDYTFWADRKLFDCVAALSEEQYRQEIDFSAGSISVQMVHTMDVERWWLHFLRTGEIDFSDDAVYLLPRESLRSRWDEVEREARAYIQSLTPEELERPVRPPFWDEHEAPPVTVWQALLQVANHSTDHRAQMMAMLHTRFGAPTFGQDFLSYLHEKAAGPAQASN
jgi:uncharacterized damage-inducible protein DinB